MGVVVEVDAVGEDGEKRFQDRDAVAQGAGVVLLAGDVRRRVGDVRRHVLETAWVLWVVVDRSGTWLGCFSVVSRHESPDPTHHFLDSRAVSSFNEV